ncbi:MAG: hypothetical protein NE330_09090 [Lentisphaeraceae bacterium]|nr:hypothetical protein [Lentisphaeraceae bacterium]
MKLLNILLYFLFMLCVEAQEKLKTVDSIQIETGFDLKVPESFKVTDFTNNKRSKSCVVSGKFAWMTFMIQDDGNMPNEKVLNLHLKGFVKQFPDKEIVEVTKTYPLKKTVEVFKQFNIDLGEKDYFLNLFIVKWRDKKIVIMLHTLVLDGRPRHPDFQQSFTSLLDLFSLPRKPASVFYETGLELEIPDNFALKEKIDNGAVLQWTYYGKTMFLNVTKFRRFPKSAAAIIDIYEAELMKNLKPTNTKDTSPELSFKEFLKSYKRLLWVLDGKEVHLDFYGFENDGNKFQVMVQATKEDPKLPNEEYIEVTKLIEKKFLKATVKKKAIALSDIDEEAMIVSCIKSSLVATVNKDKKAIEKSFLPHIDLAVLYKGKGFSSAFIGKRQDLISKAEIKILTVDDKFAMNGRTYKVSDKLSNEESKVVRIKVGANPDYLLLKKVDGTWLVDPRILIARRKKALVK